MRMIDRTILNALRHAVEDCGSQSELARQTGLGKQHISKYLKGDVRQIEHETWLKLDTVLKKYLPGEKSRGKTGKKTCPRIPVITQKQLEHFDAALMDLSEFASGLSHGFLHFPEDGKEMVALRITDNRYEPGFPKGTFVCFNDTESPSPGNRVIGKLKNSGEIVFLRCTAANAEGEKKQGCFDTISPGGKDFSWVKAAENPFYWLYPIRYIFWSDSGSDAKNKTIIQERSAKK